ncbi:hypothetical protein GBA52_012973 [Prunus armeniaca]|nr:hypothetical protein GBA52_012973 [Prunus armeniaca]
MEGMTKPTRSVTATTTATIINTLLSNKAGSQSFPFPKLSFWFAPTTRPPGLLFSSFGS